MRKRVSVSRIGLFLLMASCIMSNMLPTAVYMSVAVISMIAILFTVGKPRIPRLWLIWSIIYVIAILVNILYSKFTNVSVSFLRSTVTHLFIALVFVCSIKNKEDFLFVLKAFMYIGLIAALFVLFRERSTLLSSPLGIETFGGGNIPFTYILIPASVSCLYLIIEDRKNFYYAVLAFLLLISLLTTSRKAILLPLVFFVLYSMFHFRKSISKAIGFVLLGGVLLGFVYVAFIRQWNLSTMAVDRLSSMVDYAMEGEGDESLLIREGLIQRGLDYILERPIWGYGMGTYSDVTGSIVYSHNNYIETLFGGGIVMLVIYYSIYLICIFRLWKRADSVSMFLLSVCLVYLLSDYGTISYFVYPQLFMLIMASYVSRNTYIEVPYNTFQ